MNRIVGHEIEIRYKLIQTSRAGEFFPVRLVFMIDLP